MGLCLRLRLRCKRFLVFRARHHGFRGWLLEQRLLNGLSHWLWRLVESRLSYRLMHVGLTAIIDAYNCWATADGDLWGGWRIEEAGGLRTRHGGGFSFDASGNDRDAHRAFKGFIKC